MANSSSNGLASYNPIDNGSGDSYIGSINTVTSSSDGSHMNYMVNSSPYLHNEGQQSPYMSNDVDRHVVNSQHPMGKWIFMRTT